MEAVSAEDLTAADPLGWRPLLAAAVDESLPPGAIAIQDDDGAWWRYPLAEFTDEP